MKFFEWRKAYTFVAVLGDHPRAFKKVFKQAQKILKEVYALEMQELPMREKLTIEEKRKGMSSFFSISLSEEGENNHIDSYPSAMQSQTGGNKTSETWIVVNVLPQEYRDPVILPPSSSPTAEKEATKIGFYTLIICLIAITGGEVTEQQLFRHLGRMNADKMLGDQRTEDVLQTLEKQGYIVKKTEQISAAEDKSVTYLVGPRGKTEVGNQGVANVVRMVWGGSTPELERKIAVSLGLEEPTEDEVQESQEREAEEEEEPEAEERSTRRSSGRRSTRRHVVDDDDEN
jgi:hypothetical protein